MMTRLANVQTLGHYEQRVVLIYTFSTRHQFYLLLRDLLWCLCVTKTRHSDPNLPNDSLTPLNFSAVDRQVV